MPNHRKSRYLTSAYKKLLWNSLIPPHFDYEYSSWSPILRKNLNLKLQKAQKKCILVCVNLPLRAYIDPSHFRKKNRLPVWDRVEYCIMDTVFKYSNGTVPVYIQQMLKPSLCRYSTRLQMTLDIALRKTNIGQKSLSFLGSKIWSKINTSI